jgi:diguanylate cyclase
MIASPTLYRRFWPAVPDSVRDDLAQLRLGRLRAQVPLLYITTMVVVLMAMSAADAAAPFAIRFGFPITIITGCAMRLTWWIRQDNAPMDGDAARRLIARTITIASLICGLASLWTALSWHESIPGTRAYYPMFMTIGGLAAAFCLSSIRLATMAILVSGIGPIIAALALLGGQMERLAAAVVLVASCFLVRMIQQQHGQIVDLLLLQQRMQALAGTDVLTNMPNRRTLYDTLDAALASGTTTGIALLDLDGFKPVNDAHGHAVGDLLLCEVAVRLQRACAPGALACRLGGDEFAIVIADATDQELGMVATAVLAGLARPFRIAGHHLTIGASIGSALSQSGDTSETVLSRADVRLYEAKGLRKRPGRAGRRTA